MDCAPKNGNVRMKNAVSSAVIRCGGWCAKIHYATQLHTEANEKPERRKTNRNKFSGVDDMAEKKFVRKKLGHCASVIKLLTLNYCMLRFISACTCSYQFQHWPFRMCAVGRRAKTNSYSLLTQRKIHIHAMK